MATEDPKTIKIAVSASDDSHIPITKEQNTQNVDVEDATGIQNDVVVASDVEKDKEEGTDKNVAAASDHEKNDDDEDDLGVSVEKLNLGSKKKPLVLPITGFLVHRAFRYRQTTVPKNRQPDFSTGNFMIYKRPHCEEFLKFCFERFEVGIWSSAREHNIGGVLTNVMGELVSKLLFTWDQTQCTQTDFKCLENKDKPVFLKELDRIWKKKDFYPSSGSGYSASNTLLITDPVKALLNPPNTSISPSNYDPENNLDNLLGPSGELWVFLEGLAEANDVQTYVKEHPIGDPAITPSHADWEYYSKIIRAYGKNN